MDQTSFDECMLNRAILLKFQKAKKNPTFIVHLLSWDDCFWWVLLLLAKV